MANEERLAKVEAKLEQLFRELSDMKELRKEFSASVTASLKELEDRTRSLEKHLWMGVGALMVINVLIAVIK